MQTGVLIIDLMSNLYTKKKPIEKFSNENTYLGYIRSLIDRFIIYVYGILCLILAVKYANCHFPDDTIHLIASILASPIYLAYLLYFGVIYCPK